MELKVKIMRELLSEQILKIEDAEILHKIQRLIDISLETDNTNEAPDEYNAEIDQAVSDMKNGLGVSHETLKIERRNW